jgi:iron complex transport system substrate-binding protein
LRVVSLLPSATEMVHFAGAADALVGVTHECDHPPTVAGLPKLTRSKVDPAATSAKIDAAIGGLASDGESVYALDVGLLAELAPDLIITQGLCDVCAVSVEVVQAATATLENEPRVLSLNPTSLAGVLQDACRVGEVLGRGAETRAQVAALRERVSHLKECVAGRPRPTVGCVEWLDPPFSAGHWVPEMVGIAGGEDVFAAPGSRSVRLAWDEILRGDPEVLILMPCGFGVERTLLEARKVLPDLPGWQDLRAVKNDRVWAVDANAYFSRPAPRLVRGVEILGRILHPEVFPNTSGRGEAVHFDGPEVSAARGRGMEFRPRPL